jgi:hypothetical protein
LQPNKPKLRSNEARQAKLSRARPNLALAELLSGGVTHMNTSNPIHFALYCTTITAAFVLSMPEIPWLRPLGYAIIFACWVLFREQERVLERLPLLGLVLFCALGLVFLNVTAPHIDQPRSIRPTLSFAVGLFVAWAVCIFRQHRWWQSQRLYEPHVA